MGIGFAIPSDLAASIIDQLLENGSVERGYLGIAPQTLTADLREAMGIETDVEGVLVSNVIEGEPAEEAGLENGDIIISINGNDVADARVLTQMIGAYPPGERIRLGILRDGDERTIRVRLGERPAELDGRTANPVVGQELYFGMELDNASDEDRERAGVEDDRGILVKNVMPGSEAAEKNIRPGDLILEAGGTTINSVADFVSASEAVQERGRRALLVLVASQGGTRYAALSFVTTE